MKKVVSVKYSDGFGNHIFQYCGSRVLAEKNGYELSHHGIPELNLKDNIRDGSVGDTRFIFNVTNNFEDYTLYKDRLDDIRSWFPKVEKTNTKDLILHLRLGNRIAQNTHHMNHVDSKRYCSVIETFDFDRLHIITDADKWDVHETEDVRNLYSELQSFNSVRGFDPRHNLVSESTAVDYINELVSGLSHYDPIIHTEKAGVIKNESALKANFIDHFNFIRSFDKILFKDSTFSWWASVLSEATDVCVYGPWKPNKGKKNKNLGKTDYAGWRSWS
tara:strand:- start:3687 stop:4511 length:825 start_codon:yes stop_codon:yes gene_type:complete